MEGYWKVVKICAALLIPLSILYVITTLYIPDHYVRATSSGPYIHSRQTKQPVIASPQMYQDKLVQRNCIFQRRDPHH